MEARALVVDDNEINSLLAANILSSLGMESDVAKCGEDAIVMVKDKEYSFVLMDNIMPGITGIETTRAIREFSNVPVYAMTTDLAEEVLAAFAEAGASDSVAKPLDSNEIEHIVKNYITIRTIQPDSCDKDNDHVSLKKCLSDVEGLNYEKGLDFSMGSRKNYLKILKIAVNNIREYAQIMDSYIETHDAERLKFSSHSLKSVFAGIGMDALSHRAAQIEQTAALIMAGEEKADCDNRVRDYTGPARECALKIENGIMIYEELTLTAEKEKNAMAAPEMQVSDEELEEIFNYTYTALDRFEIDYVTEGLELLKKVMSGEARKKVKAAITAADGFDYSTIRNILNELSLLKKDRGEAR